MERRCENCEYFDTRINLACHTEFVCRRVGPVDNGGFWPPVREDDWCGEFRPKVRVTGDSVEKQKS